MKIESKRKRGGRHKLVMGGRTWIRGGGMHG
jgi:hypothetical protein